MKKNVGSLLALYPTPVTVIGAMNGDKPTWTLVAHIGIIGHQSRRTALYQRVYQGDEKTLDQPCGRGYAAGGGLCGFGQRGKDG